MYNDFSDLLEHLAEEFQPIIKVWKILNFVLKITKVDDEKANFMLQLRNQELMWEHKNDIFVKQLVEFRNTRDSFVEELVNQRADRMLIDRHIFLLKKIYENPLFPEHIKDAALDDHHRLLDAMIESFKVSAITIDKIPFIQINLGNISFPALN